MRASDKPDFARVLGEVFAGYGKPLPDGATIGIWFKMLEPFSPATIRAAFDAYAAERPDFAPVPNSIAARCKLADGRPDENEAWSRSIISRDERESVLWCEEMRDAFLICQPLLDGGDEVGARMAFKDAYKRLVAEARAANRPAKWELSAGWDGERRELVVARALSAGLLKGPQPHLALTDESGLPAERPEGLQRVLKAIEPIVRAMANPHGAHDADVEAEFAAYRQQNEEIDAKVRDYLRKNPQARYGNLPMPKDEQ